MSIVDEAKKISKNYEQLSNIYRTMILGYLIVNEGGSWSDIKKFLEAHLGPVNPNTLHFHLKSLIHNGFIVACGDMEKPVYKISDLPPEISQSIKSMAKSIKR